MYSFSTIQKTSNFLNYRMIEFYILPFCVALCGLSDVFFGCIIMYCTF